MFYIKQTEVWLWRCLVQLLCLAHMKKPVFVLWNVFW